MRRRQRNDGQTLVEFALVIPIVVVLFVGLFDVGRAVYAYSTVANAARDGARVAIVDQTANKAQSEASNQATGIAVTAAVAFRSPDLTAACSPISIGCIAEVTVTHQFTAVTPVIGTLVGPLTLASTSRLPVEAVKP